MNVQIYTARVEACSHHTSLHVRRAKEQDARRLPACVATLIQALAACNAIFQALWVIVFGLYGARATSSEHTFTDETQLHGQPNES
eukprot:6457777-Amphidinium_carterae.3